MFGKNFRFARDTILSRAQKFPERLYLQSDSKFFGFTMNFLLQLSDEELAKLKQEGDKKEKDFLLRFYSLAESNPCGCPYQIEPTFDMSKVVGIKYNSNTIPLLPKKEGIPVHYMSVVFIVKDE